MIQPIESILIEFRCCFTRKATFYWFCIIMMGFLIRCDHDGMTSFIRWLCLAPTYYDPMVRFFRASSWSLDILITQWVHWVMNQCCWMEFGGRPLLIGDGIKVVKEAKKMPAVKPLHQESDNSGKAEYISGHHFGFVGMVVGSEKKAFCLPLHGQLHEGIQGLRPFQGLEGKPATLVTRMAQLLVQTAKQTGRCCYATLDAYFAVGPTFQILQSGVGENGQRLVHLITRAKNNTVAYWDGVCGKPYQDQDKVHLLEVFDFPYLFTKAQVFTYGEAKTIEYCCVDLLWKPIQTLIRFVLVRDHDQQYILMSSDLELSPTQIIIIYSYRSKIEVMFLFLKHVIGGFCYHFWSKYYPKLKRKEKLDYSKLSETAREKLDQTVEAIERFVNLAAIALGIVQYLSLTYAAEIWKGYYGWLRTYSGEFPSERIVQTVIQTEFFSSDKTGQKVPMGRTLQLIQQRGSQPPLVLAA
jgi:hypothetical protein